MRAGICSDPVSYLANKPMLLLLFPCTYQESCYLLLCKVNHNLSLFFPFPKRVPEFQALLIWCRWRGGGGAKYYRYVSFARFEEEFFAVLYPLSCLCSKSKHSICNNVTLVFVQHCKYCKLFFFFSIFDTVIERQASSKPVFLILFSQYCCSSP